MAERMQIGEVAERTGLSQRTIRYYGEVELVSPSSRTDGGFRLYTDRDLEKLALVKRMKPLDFSLEEMREVLELLDALSEAEDLPDPRRQEMLDRLGEIRVLAEERRSRLEARLSAARAFVGHLDATLRR
ncbi:MerR family transcriptional regulator [Georgenia sp. 10Sc9-8]|uniref:MerR family transcriptional regulator n=1 Tax=Georgenia halotolerans TaxID=3028317 RepID=A0ABT5TW06_9MICO|nr:MerR family transcriptional regulator [Georgenia halotolerans]